MQDPCINMKRKSKITESDSIENEEAGELGVVPGD